jgi:two-component system LytT family response regulator
MADAIRTLIVDDEPIARRTLRLLLEDADGFELIGACDGVEALEVIPRERPDLLFLDVLMPGVDGFELLERVGVETVPAVVFVTAHDRHALRAFDVDAVDFLLKPFDDRRFATTLRRVRTALARGTPDPAGAAGAAPRHLRRLVVRLGDRITVVNVDEIDWIESADYYACLHVGERTHLVRRTMADLDRGLDPRRFFRLHRSAIVNLARVRDVVADPAGDHRVRLRSGVALPIARGRLRTLRRRLADR